MYSNHGDVRFVASKAQTRDHNPLLELLDQILVRIGGTRATPALLGMTRCGLHTRLLPRTAISEPCIRAVRSHTPDQHLLGSSLRPACRGTLFLPRARLVRPQRVSLPRLL
jgi:hypothetical protein